VNFNTADLYDAHTAEVQVHAPGERGIPVAFAGAKFTPGEWLYADEDGILLCPRNLL